MANQHNELVIQRLAFFFCFYTIVFRPFMIDHRKDMSQDSLIISFLSQLKEILKDFAEHEKTIQKAINIAKEAHKDQYRKYDKTPFIGHPLQVALNCAIYQDRQLVVAAIMHDAVEDCEETSMKMVYNTFGEDI